MPLYQFTEAETGEITRRDLVLGDDVRTLLDAGTYDVSRVEPETLSPSVTITLAPPVSAAFAPAFDGSILSDLGRAPTAPVPDAPVFDDAILTEE